MDFVQKTFGERSELFTKLPSPPPASAHADPSILEQFPLWPTAAGQRRRHLWGENRGVPLVTGIYTVSLARLQRIVGCRASRTLEGCGAPQEYRKTISQ